MNPTAIVAAGLVGIAVGPMTRAVIFTHCAPPGQPWRDTCPHCSQPIAGTLRYLPRTGTCPQCRENIGPQAATVETTTATVLALGTWRITEPATLLALAIPVVLGVALAFIDMAVHRLPDRLTQTALALAFVGLTTTALINQEFRRLAVAVICALTMAVFYLILSLIPRGCGEGDVKLAPFVGLTVGWYGVGGAIMATLIGFLMAGLLAAILALSGRCRKSSLAHGQFMLLGSLVAIVALAEGPSSLSGYRTALGCVSDAFNGSPVVFVRVA